MVKLTRKMIIIRIVCVLAIVCSMGGVAWYYWKTIYSVM